MGEEVVADEGELVLGVPENRVHHAVAGPVEDLEPAAGELDHVAVGQRPGHLHRRSPAAVGVGDAAQRQRDLLRDPAAQHQFDREVVFELGFDLVAGEPLGGDAERRHLGPGVLDDDLGESDVVSVVMGDEDKADVLDRVPVGGHRFGEDVEPAPVVGPAVDQGQRVALDQVSVDLADREGSRDRQPVDACQGGLLECLLGGARHSRINPSTSSRRRSMSSREISDSRFRRNSGSVFDGRTLKCQSGIVDRDAVEVGDLGASRRSAPRSRPSSPSGRRPRS